MAEVVPDYDDRVPQHFITNTSWSSCVLLDQIGWDVDAAIGGSDDCLLMIDESAVAKKGNKSVGVARRWNGRLGEIDSCQVGVLQWSLMSRHRDGIASR